ncbi:MAG: hypothetical protein UU24_C0004G0022 [Candidatus Nomurabacteria bacterium GW2011_GWA2_40_9]|uniref:Transcriptional modulator of MazE/toxin, MazF n=1 Tax=Candidatus Nomurabacteria bacterium GW2011_GWA2_40_9 TaxID=1618734 RepID=A0A0G0TRS2_9BACT|nr:MAG: hypothetical protein UU24_C0004G0022 [Candidatus Nomurabacteria bacterium GW2011_GWA2_40_9]
MHKGKIVLVPFPFTDLSGQKVRPALVLHSNKKNDDFIACFISSNKKDNSGLYDLKVKADKDNNLKLDSVIKVSKIATLEKEIALGEIGSLDAKIMKEIDSKLKSIFQIK